MGKASKARRAQRELQRALTGTGTVTGAVVESIPMLKFRGESFGVAPVVGLMPLLRFAHLAKQGIEADDMEGLVAIYDLLKSVIADDEWERFQTFATDIRATGDDLMEAVADAIQLISSRPSSRPSDSSDGPSTTSPSSPEDSGSRVIRRLEREGRPSIALMVRQAQEHGSRASA